MHWQVFFVLLGVSLLYLVIIWITYSWMIAAPRRFLVRSQTERLYNTIRIVALADDVDTPIAKSLRVQLNSVRRQRKRPGNVVMRSLRAVHLNDLMAAQQTLNGLSRLRVYLVPDSDLPAFADTVFARLAQVDQTAAQALSAAFAQDSTTPAGRRILIARADELCHSREEATLRTEFDQERASLWLALVGLWGIIAIGAMLCHVETLLLGAIGGFLAPLIDARLPASATKTTWGVRVLSPVGGALTAVGGLLVVSFLAGDDVKILGEVFQSVWTHADSPVALAVALLFGFSGKMFSSMAITASSQIAGANQPDPATAHPDASPGASR